MFPVLFSLRIGEQVVGIHTYGVLIALGFAAGIALAWREAQRRGLDGGRVLDLSFWILIGGLLGSRALYVLVNAGAFARTCAGSAGPVRTAQQLLWDCSRVLQVWEGGLVFYGGLLAATAVVVRFSRRQGWSFWTVGDVFAPGLAIGHALGRLGCFAAGCCFGKACDTAAAFCVRFPRDSVAFDQLQAMGAVPGDSPATPALHPTQLYEAAGEALIFFCLIALRRRQHRRGGGRPGTVLLTYGVLYAALRFFVELFRGDTERSYITALSTPRLTAALHLPLGEPILLSSGQLISLLVLAAGLALMIRRARQPIPR